MNPRLLSSLVIAGGMLLAAGQLSAPRTVPGESQWVTVIRDGAPVWVELEPSFPDARTVTPTPIVQASATATTTATRTPSVTPTQQTPAAPTVTAFPTNSPFTIVCDIYPCRAYASDWFVTDKAFRFRTSASLNIRVFAGINYAPTGARTAAGETYDVWSIILLGPAANDERWACLENQKDCRRWFAIQGDFVAPLGEIEVYSVDVTDY